MMDIKAALHKIADRKDLTGEEMRGVMRTIMAGEATPSQIGAFLMGMRIKGETVGEIAAAVSILREQMIPVEAPEDAIDIVGTGGDGGGTLNISTASAIVVVLVMLFLALSRPGKGIVPEALRAKDYQPRRRLCQQARRLRQSGAILDRPNSTTADAYEK